MDQFWENEYVKTAGDYSVVILSLVVFLAIFELVTKYNNWDEIKNGNLAVAMATGGKSSVLRISLVIRLCIMTLY